jgi:penicillin-binding protein 2
MRTAFTPDAQVVLRGRLLPLALGIVAAFGLFFLRLFQLQILESESLLLKSNRNAVRHMALAPPRGRIVDRKGRVLATTRPAFGLELMPSDLSAPGRTFAVLAELVGEESDALTDRFGRPRGRARFKPVRLVDDLSFDQLARVESHLYALAGVNTDVQPRRHYLEGPLAAHLLGSIGQISPRQLEKERFEGYRSGDVVGQTGLEAEYEAHLRGRAGARNVVVNVAGRAIGEPLDEVLPLPGGTLVLTLDLDLQRAAEEGFDELAEEGVPRIGALAAIDPRNGDVLALVSRPTYDPNAFAGGIDSELWEELTKDQWRPLHARAIQSHYPPGSTYKAFVAAAGLQEGLIQPGTRVFCPGHFRLGRRTYRCWKRPGHGSMNLHDALVQSCDVYFYQLGLQLGVDRLARFARGFGLGRRTQLGLRGEVSGLVPTAEWKERRFGEPWVRGETVSISIGQGFNLTSPLQLAVAYGAIGNGGKVVRPRIVERLEDREGHMIQEFPSEVAGQVPVDPSHLARVRRALAGVVQEPRGTGRRSRVPDVEVAGKTGTAQVVRLEVSEGLEDHEIPIRNRDHALFAAFAPAEDPEIAVAVIVEHGGHGGSTAAPIAQRVLARYFELKAEPAEPGEPLQQARLDGGQDAGR